MILLKKRHSLTGVKLIALYKELDKTRIYIHFNKQILKYSILHVAFDFFFSHQRIALYKSYQLLLHQNQRR